MQNKIKFKDVMEKFAQIESTEPGSRVPWSYACPRIFKDFVIQQENELNELREKEKLWQKNQPTGKI
jgi:hypothetical protein